MRALFPLATLALLAGCATTPGTDRLAERDPLQPVNRVIWGFNMGVDKVVLKPASTVYRTITPRPARRGLSHILDNLSEPWSAVNNLLQGKPKRALTNVKRFVINTTIGVGGLADHASKMGIKPAYEDMGQTLARWGVNGGPYLVLPLLGPSTLRDGVGSLAAQYADPYRVCLRKCLNNTEQLVAQGTELVSIRSDLTDSGADELLKSSLDPYTTAKSAYLQRRRAAILDQDGDAAAVPPAGPGDAASGNKSDDAAMDAALADIKAQQADQAAGAAATPADPASATPGTSAPATPSTGNPAAPAVPEATPPATPPGPQ